MNRCIVDLVEQDVPGQVAGKPREYNDLWIAACAIERGAGLPTSDRHFAAAPGLLCGPLPA